MIVRIALWAILLVVVIAPSGARASDPALERVLSDKLGTLSNEAEPIFSEGVLTGCSVNFSALFRDFIYRAGGFSRLDGSFSLMVAKNNIGILLKIVLHDLDERTFQLVPNAPVTAFFVSGNSTSRPFLINQSLENDTPGAILAVYNGEKTFPMLIKSVTEGIVTLAFARTKSGTDMQVPIDLGVEDTDDNGKKTRSNKVTTSFMKCASELIDAEQQRLKGK